MLDFIDMKIILQFLVPLYITHAALVLWHFFVFKYKLWDFPIDLKLRFVDNNRLIGDSKTVVGLIISLLVPNIISYLLFENFYGIYLGAGLYLGAVTSGFIKRRLKIKRGGSLPVVDQTDYIIGTYLLLNISNIIYFNSQMVPIFIIGLVLHPILVFIAYKVNLRTAPW